MKNKEKNAVICCCSVLLNEVDTLRLTCWPDWKLHHLTSMLHMRPTVLSQTLNEYLQVEKGNRVVLVYGDCCPDMEQIEHMPGVARTMGVNCCELLLGKEVYKSLIREGVFFLLPEWTWRWEDVFTRELGLSPENARAFMQEMHKKFVYLDTGIVLVPYGHIRDISHYCGLPYEILPISGNHLQAQIQDAMNRLAGDVS